VRKAPTLFLFRDLALYIIPCPVVPLSFQVVHPTPFSHPPPVSSWAFFFLFFFSVRCCGIFVLRPWLNSVPFSPCSPFRISPSPGATSPGPFPAFPFPLDLFFTATFWPRPFSDFPFLCNSPFFETVMETRPRPFCYSHAQGPATPVWLFPFPAPCFFVWRVPLLSPLTCKCDRVTMLRLGL